MTWTWENFYLVAFLVGFILSLLSFLSGAIHMPHFHFHVPGHAASGLARGGGRGMASPFNFGTGAAFLAWFGGTGYMLERYSQVWVYLALFISVMSGLGGAAVVFWFLVKLSKHDHPMDPAEYEMIGVLGKVGSPIRKDGTGEMIYPKDGARKAIPARCEKQEEIPRGTEVVVTRYEKGIVYVRRWEEMSGGEF